MGDRAFLFVFVVGLIGIGVYLGSMIPGDSSDPPRTSAQKQEAAQAKSPRETKKPVVLLKTANVRSGPGTNYEVVKTIAAGDQYTCFAPKEQDSWVKCSDGTYIYRELLSFDLSKKPAPPTLDSREGIWQFLAGTHCGKWEVRYPSGRVDFSRIYKISVSPNGNYTSQTMLIADYVPATWKKPERGKLSSTKSGRFSNTGQTYIRVTDPSGDQLATPSFIIEKGSRNISFAAGRANFPRVSCAGYD